jgi:hypothetical protein
VGIYANLTSFDQGGKTGLEGAKNIDPLFIASQMLTLLFIKNSFSQ